MTKKMELSEIFLYLDLMKMKRLNGRPKMYELEIMLYFLDNNQQVKVFNNKLEELEIRASDGFYNGSLLHFLEDYDDFINLKNKVLKNQRNRRRKYKKIFEHEILLSKSEEQAIGIIKEANVYGVTIGEEWKSMYDSIGRIKEKQIAWKDCIRKQYSEADFTKLYEDFTEKKLNYFDSLSLKQLKKTLQETSLNYYSQKTQNNAHYRSLLIKEYARKVAQGICQLCEKEAPFLDKQGRPFLEVHHIHYLSKGGSDTEDNVVALCPNCHRRIHQLEQVEDFEKIKEKAAANINV
ncbi:HNH endonuclease [Peribacillus butanolivorans]